MGIPTSNFNKGYLLPYDLKLNMFRSWGYDPHEKQELMHRACSEYPGVVACAGARGGKSYALAAEITVELFLPNRRIWLVATQYELAEKEFFHVLDFLGKIQFKGRKAVDWMTTSLGARGKKYCRTPWGSFVETKSTEKIATLFGESLTTVGLCEASQQSRTPYDRALKMRLSDRSGRILAFSTGNGDGNLFVDLLKMGFDPNEKEWWSIQFPTSDSPYVDQAYLEKCKREMADEVYREQVLGEIVSRLGKVFKLTSKHYFDDKDLPKESESWPIFVGVTGKQHNPHVIVWIKIDPKNLDYYVIDEFYEDDCTPKDLVKPLREKFLGQYVALKVGSMYERPLVDALAREQIRITTNKQKKYSRSQELIRRVQMLQNLLKVHDDGRVRLRFHRDNCPRTVEDFKEITWRPSKDEKGFSEDELPLDKHLFGPGAVSHPLLHLEQQNRNGVV